MDTLSQNFRDALQELRLYKAWSTTALTWMVESIHSIVRRVRGPDASSKLYRDMLDYKLPGVEVPILDGLD